LFVLEIDIFPFESEQLALPESGCHVQQDHDSLTPLDADGSAESIGSVSSIGPAIPAPFSHCECVSIASGKLHSAAVASPRGR
jgi:hypothetical protein